MTPDSFAPDLLAEVTEATWPPAATHRHGPWLIREGQGGGQRVSAASATGNWTEADIPTAEAAMRALGQPPPLCPAPHRRRARYGPRRPWLPPSRPCRRLCRPGGRSGRVRTALPHQLSALAPPRRRVPDLGTGRNRPRPHRRDEPRHRPQNRNPRPHRRPRRRHRLHGNPPQCCNASRARNCTRPAQKGLRTQHLAGCRHLGPRSRGRHAFRSGD